MFMVSLFKDTVCAYKKVVLLLGPIYMCCFNSGFES